VPTLLEMSGYANGGIEHESVILSDVGICCGAQWTFEGAAPRAWNCKENPVTNK
jgi:hypothetical protein